MQTYMDVYESLLGPLWTIVDYHQLLLEHY